MITVRHLSHNFGPHWALKDCTFSLEKGDFVFLSGPSGAGKTTLLRLLYAGLPIQRGEVEIVGMNLNKIQADQTPLLRRQVGVVFQDFKILPLRSVQDNIGLPLEIRGLAPQHIERRVRAVARALGLDGRLRHRCGEISGGEQQRVAIARAFVVNPQVLLADEPTGNLDPDLAYRLMELFKQFQAYGATVVFATHSKELMRRHPTAHIMHLDDGKITEANWPGARIFHGPDHISPEEGDMLSLHAPANTRAPQQAAPMAQPGMYTRGPTQRPSASEAALQSTSQSASQSAPLVLGPDLTPAERIAQQKRRLGL